MRLPPRWPPAIDMRSGYTACFEPALLPANARQAHMEMGDIPNCRGGYAMRQ